MDLVGCHRRSSYPDREDFRCPIEDGIVVQGPPCTAMRGDTFKLHVEFTNISVSDMTQVSIRDISKLIQLNYQLQLAELSFKSSISPFTKQTTRESLSKA